MLKKICGTFFAIAFVFYTVSQTNISKSLASAYSYICCDHNGDGWDN